MVRYLLTPCNAALPALGALSQNSFQKYNHSILTGKQFSADKLFAWSRVPLVLLRFRFQDQCLVICNHFLCQVWYSLSPSAPSAMSSAFMIGTLSAGTATGVVACSVGMIVDAEGEASKNFGTTVRVAVELDQAG
jgi:hypothetical protein